MCVPTLLRGVLRVASSLLVAVVLGVSLTACETSLSARIPGSPEVEALGPVSNEAGLAKTGLAKTGPGASGPGEGPDQDLWGEPPAGTGLEPMPLPETEAPEGLPTETLPPETLLPETLLPETLPTE